MTSDTGLPSVSTKKKIRQPMLDACSSGDLLTLQRLFAENGIQPGSKEVGTKYYDPRYYPDGVPEEDKVAAEFEIPPTTEMLAAAVAGKQLAIVKFILQTYPTVRIDQALEVVYAVLDNPDPAILQALIDHDPMFPSFSVDYGFRCILTEACTRPPEKIVPVLHVLLDNGGDVNDGFGPGAGTLYAAVVGGQPLEIMAKTIDKGGALTPRCVVAAIQHDRADVVEFLLNHRRNWIPVTDCEWIRKQAHASADKEIISMVEEWIERKTAQEESRKKKKEGWWQKLF